MKISYLPKMTDDERSDYREVVFANTIQYAALSIIKCCTDHSQVYAEYIRRNGFHGSKAIE